MSRDFRERPVTDENVRYVSVLPGKPGRNMCVRGEKFDAVNDDDTEHDIIFSETREIQGAWLEVTNAEAGDYAELFILMPDDVLVGQFGETVFIPPSGKVEQIVSEGTVSFPSGFKLRLTYHAVSGGQTRTVYAFYRLRK